jgi:hypothetical protein
LQAGSSQLRLHVRGTVSDASPSRPDKTEAAVRTMSTAEEDLEDDAEDDAEEDFVDDAGKDLADAE